MASSRLGFTPGRETCSQQASSLPASAPTAGLVGIGATPQVESKRSRQICVSLQLAWSFLDVPLGQPSRCQLRRGEKDRYRLQSSGTPAIQFRIACAQAART